MAFSRFLIGVQNYGVELSMVGAAEDVVPRFAFLVSICGLETNEKKPSVALRMDASQLEIMRWPVHLPI